MILLIKVFKPRLDLSTSTETPKSALVQMDRNENYT